MCLHIVCMCRRVSIAVQADSPYIIGCENAHYLVELAKRIQTCIYSQEKQGKTSYDRTERCVKSIAE